MAPKCLPPELLYEFVLFIPVEDAIPNVLSSCCLLHNILRPRVIKWEKKMQKLIDEFGKFRRDFDGFRGEVRRDFSEVRRDFDGFRGEFDGFRGEFDGFRGEVRTELSTMKNRFEVLDKPFGQLPVSPQTLEHNWAQFIDYLVQANNGVTGRMATLTNAVERLNAGDTDEADKLYGDVTALDSDCTDLAEMVHRIAQLPNVAQATQLATLAAKVTCDKSQLFEIRLELMRKEDGEQRMRRKAQQILHELKQENKGTMTEDKQTKRSSLSSLAHRRSSAGIKVSTGVKPLHVRVRTVVAARAIHLTWSVPKGVVDYDKISAYVVRYKVDDGEGAADSAVGGGLWKFVSKRQHVASTEYEGSCQPLCPDTSYKICIWVEDRHGKALHTHKINVRTNAE